MAVSEEHFRRLTEEQRELALWVVAGQVPFPFWQRPGKEEDCY